MMKQDQPVMCVKCRKHKPARDFMDIKDHHFVSSVCKRCRDIASGRVKPMVHELPGYCPPSITCEKHASKNCQKCYPQNTLGKTV